MKKKEIRLAAETPHTRDQTAEETGYDTVAVDIDSSKVLWTYPAKTRDDAEAAADMAVMRQGCADRFFTVEPRGKYKVGDSHP